MSEMKNKNAAMTTIAVGTDDLEGVQTTTAKLAGVTLHDDQQEKSHGPKKSARNIVKRFDEYFGGNTLANWQRLCRDIGLRGNFTSKTQCRKALKGVYINIHDLLDALEKQQVVLRFPSRKVLQEYTKQTGKFYPLKKAKEHGPVRALLIDMFN